MVARGWRSGMGSECLMGMEYDLGDEDVLELNTGGGCTARQIQCHGTVASKMVHFT